MAQIDIPADINEIYAVDAMSGSYDRTEGFACDFYSWIGYPKYFTDYEEAKQHYDSIEISNSDGCPEKKTLTTISLVDSDDDESEETE